MVVRIIHSEQAMRRFPSSCSPINLSVPIHGGIRTVLLAVYIQNLSACRVVSRPRRKRLLGFVVTSKLLRQSQSPFSMVVVGSVVTSRQKKGSLKELVLLLSLLQLPLLLQPFQRAVVKDRRIKNGDTPLAHVASSWSLRWSWSWPSSFSSKHHCLCCHYLGTMDETPILLSCQEEKV